MFRNINHIWIFFRNINLCNIMAILLLVFAVSYCAPFAIEPVDEYRFPSLDQTMDAVVRYYAYGGAAGEWFYTIDIVPRSHSPPVFRPWLEAILDKKSPASAPAVGRIKSPEYHLGQSDTKKSNYPIPVWVNTLIVHVKYCGRFEYYQNYKKIDINNKNITVFIDIEDMCHHERRW